MMDIRPGLPVRLVVDTNHIKETNDVRSSMIFDVNENKLILAQTDPPVLRSRINKTVILTYIIKEKKEVVRYGFDTVIVDLLKDYELSAYNRTQAIILLKKTEPIRYNLRFFYRVEPPGNSGIGMSIYNKPVSILDISIGGAKISHKKDLKLQSGKAIAVKLSIDDDVFNINAIILRNWGPQEERMAGSIEFAAMEFIDTSLQVKNILGKKIFDIQRELRSREIM